MARATVQADTAHAAHLASLRPAPRTRDEARVAQRQKQERIVYRGLSGRRRRET